MCFIRGPACGGPELNISPHKLPLLNPRPPITHSPTHPLNIHKPTSLPTHPHAWPLNSHVPHTHNPTQ